MATDFSLLENGRVVQRLGPDDLSAVTFIYAIDPSGLTSNGIVAARIDGLKMFAENTGGRATVATNTPWDAVPQIFQENSSYYLTGYRSTNRAADGRSRRLTVKVNRPAADFRTRSGYYAPSPAKPSTSPPTPSDKALSGARPGGDLKFGVTLAPFYVPGQRDADVTVIAGLTARTASSSQIATITTAAFDSDWKQRYQVRVATEEDDAAGSVFADVDIPDYVKEPLTLSGLILAAKISAPAEFYQRGSKPPAEGRVTAAIVDDANRTNYESTTSIDASKIQRPIG